MKISVVKESKEDLTNFFIEMLKIAISNRNEKNLQKSKSIQAQFIEEFGIPAINYNHNKYDENDLIGLLGEISSSEFLERNSYGNGIYLKWRATGTSKSPGVDLFFENDGNLLIIECKHPHKALSNSASDPKKIILRTFDAAFKENSEYHSKFNMFALLIRYRQKRRFEISSALDPTQTNSRITMIENALQNNSYSTNVLQVMDNEITDKFKLEDLSSKIDFNRYMIKSPLLAISLGISTLRTVTKQILIMYGGK